MDKENNSLKKNCFICNNSLEENKYEYNKQVNLPVCNKCIGTDDEQKAVEDALDSLADGLLCGCI